MTNFEFVFSLFGLLLGLALAEVLAGFGTAVQSRSKVRIGWLTPLLGLIVALDLTSFWTSAWAVRDLIPPVYFSMMCGLLLTGLYYLVARLVFPHDQDEWPDYDDYYFAHKRLVIGGVLLCNLLAMAGQMALGYDPFTEAVSTWGTIIFLASLPVAMWAPGRAANIALLAFIVFQYVVVSTLLLVRG